MKALKALLVIELLLLTAYTGVVIQNQGFDLVSHFVGNITTMGWSGQFNLDFMVLLTLSGIWVSWRHGNSPLGVLLGVFTALGGSMVLCPYLLIEISKSQGNMKALLLGQRHS
ncbi:MAG TPA: hypothetical protein VGE55_05225 [Limnobacter sp.]|uniref:hypothetical protein n=1 Tax=Limnobacter sp. TaxID=2003368 RepID=UPI002EDAF66B